MASDILEQLVNAVAESDQFTTVTGQPESMEVGMMREAAAEIARLRIGAAAPSEIRVNADGSEYRASDQTPAVPADDALSLLREATWIITRAANPLPFTDPARASMEAFVARCLAMLPPFVRATDQTSEGAQP